MSENSNPLDREYFFPSLLRHRCKRNQVFRLMAGMMKRGYPLPDILLALAGFSLWFQGPLRRMATRVNEGVPLADALEDEWRRCPRLVIELARLGEHRGILPSTLALASELIENEDREGKKSELKNFLTYLWLVAGLLILIVLLLGVYVTPVFNELFAQSGMALPGFTGKVLGYSNILVNHFGLTILFLVAAVLLIKFGPRRLRGVAWLERAPVLGRLVGYRRWWRIAYGAGMLNRLGVPVDAALRALGRGMGYPAVEDAAARINARLAEGKSVAEAMEGERALAPMFRWAVASGYAAGDLAQTLIRFGEMTRELEAALTAQLIPVLEVVLIFVLALAAGLFVTAMYLPLLSLGGMTG
jgi:type II secretory pathway component PulF